MSRLLEIKNGEVFEVEGIKYQCVEDSNIGEESITACIECAFTETMHCNNVECRGFNRKDKKNVSFKEI